MRYRPEIPFTVTYLPDNVTEEVRRQFEAQKEERGLFVRCSDEQRLGQLAIKLDEYTRRASSSPDKRVVRNAICKMAILDMMLSAEDGGVDYVDSFDYAREGLELYGGDLLIESKEEAEAFFKEYDEAFNTIWTYVKSGNQFVTGGTQLPEAI